MTCKTALFGLAALAALAGCATPQERCVNRATAETRNLQSLLAEVNGNLARGYAWQEYEIPLTRWDVCGYDVIRRPDGAAIERPRMCLIDDSVTQRRRVAIDPAAEERSRDGLVARLAAIRPQMNAAVAACKAAYPDPAPAAPTGAVAQ